MKMERKLNKMYAGAIALMMVSIVFASVFATRTFTDSNDTWTGTIVQSGNLDFKSGSYFNLSKKIWNSKGHIYNASAANAQDVIDDLANSTGWIDFGGQFINLTVPLNIGRNCELRNFNFSMVNNANRSIIENYTNAVPTNVYIHDGYLNGNGLNQPAYIPTSGDTPPKVANGIQFKYLYNSKVENVVFRNIPGAGFLVYGSGSNITARDCEFYLIGKIYEGVGDHLDMFLPCGVFFDGCNNTIITGNYFNDIHGDCIVVEGVQTGTYADKTTISDNHMKNAYNGVWLEYMRNCEVINCIASNMNKIEAYDTIQQPSGFLAANCQNVSFTNCLARYCGNTAGLNGSGFVATGSGITFTGCHSMKTYGYGLQTSAVNSTIMGCCFRNDSRDGIYIGALGGNIKITGNTITKPGKAGIFVNPSGRVGMVISDNVIEDANTYGIWTTASYSIVNNNNIYRTRTYGIYCDGVQGCTVNNNLIYKTVATGSDGIQFHQNWGAYAPNNNTVMGNVIYDPVDDGIVLQSNTKNCTLIGNIVKMADVGIYEVSGSNYNIIVGNNCYQCVTPIDVSGTNTTWFCSNGWRYGYNWGAIS